MCVTKETNEAFLEALEEIEDLYPNQEHEQRINETKAWVMEISDPVKQADELIDLAYEMKITSGQEEEFESLIESHKERIELYKKTLSAKTGPSFNFDPDPDPDKTIPIKDVSLKRNITQTLPQIPTKDKGHHEKKTKQEEHPVSGKKDQSWPPSPLQKPSPLAFPAVNKNKQEKEDGEEHDKGDIAKKIGCYMAKTTTQPPTGIMPCGASSVDSKPNYQELTRKFGIIIKNCAEAADRAINLENFGARKPLFPSLTGGNQEIPNQPTSEQCKEVVGQNTKGTYITRAMRLGAEKHERAEKCVKTKLEQQEAADLVGMVKVEACYKEASPGKVEFLGENMIIKDSIRPDFVLHEPGDPLKVKAIFDMKFPCPSTNQPRWSTYTEGPYKGRTQGDVYMTALGVLPVLIRP